jgi:hypothetical protein
VLYLCGKADEITQNLCIVIAQVGFGLGASLMQVSCVTLVPAIFDLKFLTLKTLNLNHSCLEGW